MCYKICETTVKPDVHSNVSMYSLAFAEVETGAQHVASVRTLCRLSSLEWPWFPFIPPPKIRPLPLAERDLVIESH